MTLNDNESKYTVPSMLAMIFIIIGGNISLSSSLIAQSKRKKTQYDSIAAKNLEIKRGNPNMLFPDVLEKYGIGTDHDSLIGALKHPDHEVRVVAAGKLAMMPDMLSINHDVTIIPFITTAFVEETDKSKKIDFAFWLSVLEENIGLEYLKMQCVNKPGTRQEIYRMAAIEFLSRVNNESCFSDLLDVIQHSKSNIRVQNGLGLMLEHKNSIKDDKNTALVIKIILTKVTDKDKAIKITACEVLRKLTGGNIIKITNVSAPLNAILKKENDPEIIKCIRSVLIPLTHGS